MKRSSVISECCMLYRRKEQTWQENKIVVVVVFSTVKYIPAHIVFKSVYYFRFSCSLCVMIYTCMIVTHIYIFIPSKVT